MDNIQNQEIIDKYMNEIFNILNIDNELDFVVTTPSLKNMIFTLYQTILKEKRASKINKFIATLFQENFRIELYKTNINILETELSSYRFLIVNFHYLNEFNKEQIPIYSTVQKHTNRINKEISWALRIDKFANFRWQGFYVAKGIAYFLLEYDNKMANMMCRNELILEVKREELICDVFARFLLLPVSIVISEYIQEKQIVLKHNANADFCEHLTNKSGMPEIEVSKAWYEIQLMYMLTEK